MFEYSVYHIHSKLIFYLNILYDTKKKKDINAINCIKRIDKGIIIRLK